MRCLSRNLIVLFMGWWGCFVRGFLLRRDDVLSFPQRPQRSDPSVRCLVMKAGSPIPKITKWKPKNMPSRYKSEEMQALLPDKNQEFKLMDALAKARALSCTKFLETLELHVRLSIDPRKNDQMIRSYVTFPHRIGKTRRIAICCSEAQKANAEEAGADLIGGEADLIKSIQAGTIDFEMLIATPDMMAKLGRLGKILGPKGLMPSAKMGTVTTNLKETVEKFRKDTYQFRNDKGGQIHMGVGKLTLTDEQLADNIWAVIDILKDLKPQGLKGKYCLSSCICTSMGPALKLDLSEIGLNAIKDK
uniref:Ribosomal protein n=1 Tax=Chromera velia CCMP2878 TaxID=1169474 RepID=A0A0G4GDG2_9ALVE|eukprot:Cvel_21377.t1-p1 / transcript=Cvel_21377.t1 / gene=Cvel_21377 / organism=Chromera_velia_CCMP2878 / gene_product=50S ribosomal protein L1, chloroplastic, putative / transcript_product=50S ribosomal protein L1, chloroplastic, putative / location=Cvel_scaffold2000:693-1601(-) / protein_length=303 / sequence_SO=supercontig / SO=protein_coding / is_pseudo=false